MTNFDSRSLTARSFLSDARYVIPAYQREYRWKTRQIEALIQDIVDFISEAGEGHRLPYWLGTCLVCGRQDGSMEVIDGQQRLTTVTVLASYILHRLRGHKEFEDLCPKLKEMLTSGGRGGIGTPNLDFRSRGPQAVEAMRLIITGAIWEEKRLGADVRSSFGKSPTAANLVAAAREMDHQLGNQELWVLEEIGWVLADQVTVARVRTDDVGSALRVFEGMNNRGIGLDAIELAKNLVFQKANGVEGDVGEVRSQIGERWGGMLANLASKPSPETRPARFLRYAMMADFHEGKSGDDIAEASEGVFNWLRDPLNEPRTGLAERPVAFADLLNDMSASYMCLRRFAAPDGSRSSALEAIRRFTPASKTHLIFLLAARRLSPDQFEAVARELENLLFVIYACAGDSSAQGERLMMHATSIIRPCTDEAVRAFAVMCREEKSMRRDAFVNALMLFRIGGTRERDPRKARYALAKIAGWMEREADGQDIDCLLPRAFGKGSLEVEHIMPQAAVGHPGNPGFDQICCLGNLTLLEGAINASIQDDDHAKKLPLYGESKVTLTRILARPLSVGTNTRPDRARKLFHKLGFRRDADWGSGEIQARMDAMIAVSLRVWDVA